MPSFQTQGVNEENASLRTCNTPLFCILPATLQHLLDANLIQNFQKKLEQIYLNACQAHSSDIFNDFSNSKSLKTFQSVDQKRFLLSTWLGLAWETLYSKIQNYWNSVLPQLSQSSSLILACYAMVALKLYQDL